MTGLGASGNAVGPMSDERHPMPPFPGTCLDAAERTDGTVAKTLRVLGVPDGAIVAGKEDQGIVGHARLLQTRHDLTHDLVHQHREIPVHAGPALTNEFLGREPGCVRRRQGQVEEERFLAVMAGNHLAGLLGEARRHLDVLEVGRNVARPPEGALYMVPPFLTADTVACSHGVLRSHGGLAAAHVEIRLDVEGGMHPEKGGEAAVRGASGDGFVVVKGNRFAGSGRKVLLVETEVPLPHHGGLVTPIPQQAGNGWATFGYDGAAVVGEGVFANGEAPGQEGIARRLASGPTRMSIGEGQATDSQLIQVRRRDLAFRVVGLEVAISHVVGENEHNVRLL